MYQTILSATELQTLVASGEPLTIFDASFELMQPFAGDQQYLQTHIAGAVRADLNRHLSALHDAASAGQCASGGRHPLPTREAFAQWLGSIGFSADMQAVVYDRQGGVYCGRLWWMLKWLGVEAAAVLDGGLSAWQAVGGAVAAGEEAVRTACTFAARAPLLELTSADAVLQRLGRPEQTLIDARAPARFRGEVEPLDPVAGHIPGALNRPTAQNFASDGKFKSADVLRAEFDALLAGRDPATVVHHCGSGVSAIPNVLAMAIAGLPAGALFAGSWSEWCANPVRPVARG